MIKYKKKTGSIEYTDGGYRSAGADIYGEYTLLGRSLKGMLYTPVEKNARSKVGIIVVHSHEDYSSFDIAPELARYGYTVFAGRVSEPEGLLDNKFRDIAVISDFLRTLPDVEKIVLMGHSGGATLMSGYERAAENGTASLKVDNMIFKCTLPDDERLPEADAVLLLDSNFGNGTMTVISLDPAVKAEGNGNDLDPALDSYTNPDSGFTGEGTHFTEEFKAKFFSAQAKRNNALLDTLIKRIEEIDADKGDYIGDEPIAVAGGEQMKPCNKLINQDTALLSHTKGEYDLLHKDGSTTREVIYSVRDAFAMPHNPTKSLFGTLQTTVKEYVCEHGVYVTDDYRVGEDGVYGVRWEDTYNCTPGNVAYVKAPTLIMGMTGSYEYLASEVIYENSAAEDKTIAFVEGADHNFAPNERAESTPGEYGDTRKVLYDYVDAWIANPDRGLL